MYERGSLYCYFHRGMDGKCVGCVDKGDPYGFCFDLTCFDKDYPLLFELTHGFCVLELIHSAPS